MPPVGAILQRLHISKVRHSSFPSTKRLVWVFRPIVEPATLEQDILDLAQRPRIADMHHHREANDLGRRVEIAEGVFLSAKARERSVLPQAVLL